ncbi:RHS repeat-associated core domain protein containing protein [Pseudomonas sp. GM18]|uniref:RHS repeat-associated core domain-containing protein n=1 Tax=Pseudomonas sp. GM18 TaxID=1144324 RepID=UPI00027230B2|nr:RHS repeat-associated core domain-containing protein [Pseudomonas sp. GM18]EJM16130.1 RHS repeat-associated core domain protein containing protein [Pseudomonas sp. GM18]
MTGSVYLRTPDVIANDNRGLPIRQVAYLRREAGDAVESLISRHVHNTAGQLIEQWDPRLSRPAMSNVHLLSGEPIKIVSVDAGCHVTLPGLAGEERQRWDQRDNHWRTTYDNQLRVVAVEENATPNVETFRYADASAPAGHNLRGQMIELNDPSGRVEFHSFGLTAQTLRETRTFHDAKAFVSSHTFSPLGTLLEQIDAGGHRQQSIYNIAGQLQQVKLQLKDQSGWQTVLQDARYNAAGQIIEQMTGNGVSSRWLYDPADGRLHRQIAQKDPASVLQDFEYRYDRMGNITAILDHAFTPVFFANQQVDGNRTFTYDSLYRLLSATGYADTPPSGNPGYPQPTDPNDRRNYTETYEYDRGNNLVKTIHVREGASHTHEMFIDPASNRGVRWKPGDPPPDFTTWFDPAGNQLYLQPGQRMQWNSLGQLERVTLVDRNGSGSNDEEHYRYSQAERVYKRHETHTTKVSHFHDVRYLPGLEIRTKDNGEELHVITLDIGPGSARCLHWEQDPANIGADQLRYTLSDHLGSAVKELDGQAQLISDEGYLPFGATAHLTTRSAVEVSYRTVRYSGKEMDVSGLYYYGARYYAPWLGRWISADPAGDVDGPNLYAFVSNNPVTFVDNGGLGLGDFMDQFVETPQQRDQRKAQSAADQAKSVVRGSLSDSIERHIKILGISKRRALDAQQQILNHRSASDHALSSARRTAVHLLGQGMSYGAGIVVGVGAQALGAVAPGVGNVAGAVLGFAVKKAVSLAVDYVAERTGASASVKLKSGKLSPEKIITKAEYKTLNFTDYIQQKFAHMNFSSQKNMLKAAKEVTGTGAGLVLKAVAPDVAGSASAGVSALLGTVEIVHEVAGAGTELSAKKIAKADSHLSNLIEALNTNMDNLERDFAAAGVDAMHTFSFLGASAGDTVESLRSVTNKVVNELNYTRTMLHSGSRKFSAV